MRASSSSARPLRAAAAERVWVSRPLRAARSRRVAADRASGCSRGTAAARSAVPITAAALATARSGPTRIASEASSSATSRSICRREAASSAKLKSASHGRPDPVDHHVDGPQGPVGQVRVVQPGHGRPESLQQVVGDLPGREQVQRAPRHQVHDQRRGAAGCHDDTVHPRHVDARPFGQQRQQRLVLDGLPQRGGGSPVAHALEPDGPVGPVQQVGLTLIRAERLDEQPPPVRGDRGERP